MKINGHDISLGNILTVLGMLAALGGVWGTLSADNADTKRRVTTVEKRHDDDRKETREDQKEIKQDVRETKEQVQQIRILLERMGRERSAK